MSANLAQETHLDQKEKAEAHTAPLDILKAFLEALKVKSEQELAELLKDGDLLKLLNEDKNVLKALSVVAERGDMSIFRLIFNLPGAKHIFTNLVGHQHSKHYLYKIDDQLRIAAEMGHVGIVRLLLQIPAIVAYVVRHPQCVLLGIAARHGQLEVARAFLSIPAIVAKLNNRCVPGKNYPNDKYDDWVYDPLLEAAQHDKLNVVIELLELPGYQNDPKHLDLVFREAISEHAFNVARHLLDLKSVAEGATVLGLNVLRTSATYGQVFIVEKLLHIEGVLKTTEASIKKAHGMAVTNTPESLELSLHMTMAVKQYEIADMMIEHYLRAGIPIPPKFRQPRDFVDYKALAERSPYAEAPTPESFENFEAFRNFFATEVKVRGEKARATQAAIEDEQTFPTSKNTCCSSLIAGYTLYVSRTFNPNASPLATACPAAGSPNPATKQNLTG